MQQWHADPQITLLALSASCIRIISNCCVEQWEKHHPTPAPALPKLTAASETQRSYLQLPRLVISNPFACEDQALLPYPTLLPFLISWNRLVAFGKIQVPSFDIGEGIILITQLPFATSYFFRNTTDQHYSIRSWEISPDTIQNMSVTDVWFTGAIHFR